MIIAIDVGATKTLVGEFSTDGQLANEMRFETPHNFEKFMETLVDHIRKLSKPSTISIAIPGKISHDGSTILECGNLNWKSIPLKRILEEMYNCPIYIENDAKLAALSEINFLSPTPNLGVYLTISTGIGSGIVIDSNLYESLSDTEAGHMLIQHENQLVHWENFASGRAILNKHHKLGEEIDDPKIWQEIADNICSGLYSLIPTINPDTIVFGGGMGLHLDNFIKPLINNLRTNLEGTLPQITKAHYGHESVLYGCHYYVTHKQPIRQN